MILNNKYYFPDDFLGEIFNFVLKFANLNLVLKF